MIDDHDGPGNAYERFAHTAGVRALAPNDRSSYSQVTLTVTRLRSGAGAYSVIVRRVGRGTRSDTRIAAGLITLLDESEMPVSAVGALRLALHGLDEPVHG